MKHEFGLAGTSLSRYRCLATDVVVITLNYLCSGDSFYSKECAYPLISISWALDVARPP